MLQKKILYLGDGNPEFIQQVKQLDGTAFLVTKNNLDTFKHGSKSGYSSMRELDTKNNLVNALNSADQIHYINSLPATFNPMLHCDTGSNVLQLYLEHYNYKTNKVVGLKNFCSTKFKELKKPITNRRSNVWIAGCSVTFGVGVEVDERYGSLIEKEFGVVANYIAIPGGSNQWVANQLLKSNIQKNDIIFWGITNPHRLHYRPMHNEKHINTASYVQDKQLNTYVDISRLTSFDNLYQNIDSVIQVAKYANSIDATLFMQSVIPDFFLVPFLNDVKNHLAPFELDQTYTDFGTDNLHPGPEQHKIFAKNFMDMYYKSLTS